MEFHHQIMMSVLLSLMYSYLSATSIHTEKSAFCADWQIGHPDDEGSVYEYIGHYDDRNACFRACLNKGVNMIAASYGVGQFRKEDCNCYSATSSGWTGYNSGHWARKWRTCTFSHTPIGMMFIVGEERLEKFELKEYVLDHVSSDIHSRDIGCYYCAYSKHGQDLYMDGSLLQNQTSVLHSDGTIKSQPDLPTPFHNGPFSFIINDRQYVGGLNSNIYSNEVYSRALSNMGSWDREVNLPGTMLLTARSGVVSQQVVYITGGYFDGSDSPAAWSWSPGQATWKMLPSMRYTHFLHCNVMVNSEIFVIGGHLNYWNEADDSVEVFNLKTETWSLRSGAPKYLLGPSCAAVGTDIYVHNEDTVYRYNTVRDTWAVYNLDMVLQGDTAMLIV